jgi:flagellar protein FlgJ
VSVDAIRSQAYTDIQALGDLKRQARANDPAAMRETARQFETLFAKMMLKSMREASAGDELFDSQESQMYRGMFDDQMAFEVTKGRGLGVADLMVQQLMRTQVAQQAAAAGEAGRTSLNQELKREAAGIPLADPTTVFVPLRSQAVAAPVPLPARLAAPAVQSSAPAAQPTAPAAQPAASTVPAEAPTAAVSRPSAPGSRVAFLESILPAATKAAQALGVSPRSILAQAALETGWGRSMPLDAQGRPSLNLFGIKATPSWRGATAASETTEFFGGQATRQVERFRAYDSFEASFADHARLLSSSARYAGALNSGDDTHTYAKALQTGGYATDPHYARKLVAVAESVDQLLAGRLPDRHGS